MSTSKRQQASEDRVNERVTEILNGANEPVPPPPETPKVTMNELNITNKTLVHGAISLMKINISVLERIFLDPHNDKLHPGVVQTSMRCLQHIAVSCELMVNLLQSMRWEDKKP